MGKNLLRRLPIFVRIVQFAQAQTDEPTLTLDTYVREKSQPRWAPLFCHALEAGEALLLLDGLDEVAEAHQRKSVAEAIQTMVADYAPNAFLVSSRIVGYQAARLSGDFAHFAIEPLSLEHIAAFVEKWYEAIERKAGMDLSKEAHERAKALSRTIEDRPGIQCLAENPLLLTIIALLNWRGRRLPNRRVELYAHAAETLIASWPFVRQGVTLDTERVIRLLSPVAYRIFSTRPSDDIDEDDLLPLLTDTICRVDGVNKQVGNTCAEEFLKQISERSGIFRERGYDERNRRTFGFLHLTFAEYFTARYLAGLWEEMDDEARRTLLRRYAHAPRWREVVLLMAGDIGLRDNDRASRATRLMSDILQLGSLYEDRLHRDLLLGGECLADDLRVQPQAIKYVLSGLLNLVLEPGLGDAVQNIFRTMRGTAFPPPLENLMARLEDVHEGPNVRGRIASALGNIGDAGAVEALVAQLEDEDSTVRVRVVEALGNIGDVQAVDALMTRLDDDSISVWMTAKLALDKIEGAWVAEPLLARLEDVHEDPNVRGRAALALGDIGDARAVEALVARLEDENEDRDFRKGTALALGDIGDARAAEALVARLEDTTEDSDFRESVAFALNYFDDTQVVEALLGRLEDKNEDPGVRWYATFALGEIGDARVVKALVARLEDENEDLKVREIAASALSRFNVSQAAEALVALLENANAERSVRGGAASALGRIGGARAVEALVARLEDANEDLSVRERATSALNGIGSAPAVEALVARLVDANEDRSVRWWAAETLGNIGDARATEALMARLLDEKSADDEFDDSSYWRGKAATALGRIGDARAISVLLERLVDGDEDRYVQARAYEALVAILNKNIPSPEPETTVEQPESGPWDG